MTEKAAGSYKFHWSNSSCKRTNLYYGTKASEVRGALGIKRKNEGYSQFFEPLHCKNLGQSLQTEMFQEFAAFRNLPATVLLSRSRFIDFNFIYEPSSSFPQNTQLEYLSWG